MPNPRDVLVAHLHTPDVAASFSQSLRELILADFASPGGMIGDEIHSQHSTGGIPDGRNQAVEHLLRGRMEWLFFVDADMGFKRDVLSSLRESADLTSRPIVGGLCFRWKEAGPDGMSGFHCEPQPTIYDWRECPDGFHRFTVRPTYPIAHLIPVAATGAACLLIHRSVFERMATRFGRTWFDRTLGDDGQILGEDLAFFDRCRRMSVPVHVNTGVRTSHAKTTWVSEWDYWRQLQAPPASDPVDVIVPVLHRPQNVEPFLRSLFASTGFAVPWFVCEPGDEEEIAAVRSFGGRVIEHAGSFAAKTNHAYEFLGTGGPAPWIFLCGDDVSFSAGWLDHAQAVAEQYGASVIGTNDLGNPNVIDGTHATHMLIRRTYVEQVGATFHEGPGVVCGPYRHCFVDNEIVLAAMKRGVWQMALGSIVEHLHPLWGKAEVDDVYLLGRSFEKADEALFMERAERFFATEAVAA